ncbi:MAG TPA: glycosyltransferase [Acidobacteriaceae bacterium]
MPTELVTSVPETSPVAARGLRVLHILDICLPMLTGYTIRSRDIIHGERSLGMEPSVISSPVYNFRSPGAVDAVIDGISYKRTPIDGVLGLAIRKQWPVLKELAAIELLQNRIVKELRSAKYDVIHAHSPAICGIAGLRAAKKCGVPFVYEIRAFWEDAAVDQNRTGQKSMRYKASRGLEQHVVENADAVVAIAQPLLSDLRERGIPSEKLFYVPNGVDLERFKPLVRDEALAAELGIGEEPVMGFIGSFYFFEGVSWLVRAAAELHRRGVRFKLLIAGHGEDTENLRKAIAAEDAAEYVLFVGKVDPSQIQRYYSLVDVMVYPRHSSRLTELVTPLKPLEALAQKKAVLGSNVGGIRELMNNGEGDIGLLFHPDDVEDFCKQATLLFTDTEARERIAENGFQYALNERDWRQNAKRYIPVYDYARTHCAAKR